jgi:hypothetical protein
MIHHARQQANYDQPATYWYARQTYPSYCGAPQPQYEATDHVQMCGVVQFLRESQARLESEMREKYRYKKKLRKARIAAQTRTDLEGSAVSSAAENRIPMVVWIIPIAVVVVVFAVWVVWMILKIDGRTSAAVQPTYYVTPAAAQPMYYVTQ